MDKVYVLMFGNEIAESVFYTDEDAIASRVESLNAIGYYSNNAMYWYKTLTKG